VVYVTIFPFYCAHYFSPPSALRVLAINIFDTTLLCERRLADVIETVNDAKFYLLLDNYIKIWCNTNGFSSLRRKVPQHVVD
jgi:hypothetical protein